MNIAPILLCSIGKDFNNGKSRQSYYSSNTHQCDNAESTLKLPTFASNSSQEGKKHVTFYHESWPKITKNSSSISHVIKETNSVFYWIQDTPSSTIIARYVHADNYTSFTSFITRITPSCCWEGYLTTLSFQDLHNMKHLSPLRSKSFNYLHTLQLFEHTIRSKVPI